MIRVLLVDDQPLLRGDYGLSDGEIAVRLVAGPGEPVAPSATA